MLTQTNDLPALLDAMRASSIPLLKVVTGWGWPWDDGSRIAACTMAELIVRTQSGDGGMLAPGAVIQELEPWVGWRGNILAELGNEPNIQDASDDAAWGCRYQFLETLSQVRARWPAVRIVSPGLASPNRSRWWEICRDVFQLADYVGCHFYAWHSFAPEDTGEVQHVTSELRNLYPDKAWLCTEAGINDAATDAAVKAERYSALHRGLDSHFAAACWYHICDEPLDADQAAYALPESVFGALGAAGSI